MQRKLKWFISGLHNMKAINYEVKTKD